VSNVGVKRGEIRTQLFRCNIEHVTEARRVQVVNFLENDQEIVLRVIIHHQLSVPVEDQTPYRVQYILPDRISISEIGITGVDNLNKKQFQQEDECHYHEYNLNNLFSSLIHNRFFGA